MPEGLSGSRYMALSRNVDLPLTPEDHAVAGGVLHFCDDWDFLLIDKTDSEFSCCCCLFEAGYPDKPSKD